MSNRALAARIARDLFTNGQGRRAHRLAFEWDGKPDGSKWVEWAVAKRVLKILDDAKPRTRARGKR